MLTLIVTAALVTQISAIGEASTSYNDSAFLADVPGAQPILLADGIYSTRLGFVFAAESERSRHFAEVRGGYQGFVKNSGQNTWEGRGDASSEVDVSDRWMLRLSDRFMYGSANTVSELGAPVFVGQQLGATEANALQLGPSNFFENVLRMAGEYNLEERWQVLPEIGYEVFFPLDVFGRMDVPLNQVLYERTRVTRGYTDNRFWGRQEQSLLIPPENRDKITVSLLTAGWGHQLTPEIETRIEAGGSLAMNTNTGARGFAPHVALQAVHRTERLNMEIAAGFENTVNVEFGGLNDVYYGDASALYRPTESWSFEVASGYRKQLFENLGARGAVAVSQLDAYYGMGGFFYHVNEEMTLFSRSFYRRQFTDYVPNAAMPNGDIFQDITFTRIVVVGGVRVEWPRVSQRRIRH
jgi:hypothetical protein